MYTRIFAFPMYSNSHTFRYNDGVGLILILSHVEFPPVFKNAPKRGLEVIAIFDTFTIKS